MDQKTLVEQLQGRSEFIENYLGASALVDDLRDEFKNKYLLNFGDDYDDFSYRVIIQERGYTGAVLPMVGGADPVQLEWESDDDFYQPIRGSKCTINLMVTDSVSYENFYEQPEKTYKVLVQWYGADPVGGRNRWNTFWSGWLVADSFKELVSTKPYPIKLEAHDGLGSIDDFKINAAAYQPQFSTESEYPLQIKIIADILRNIDLKLDIIAMHEWLSYRLPTQALVPTNSAAFDSFIFNGEQKSTKEILEAILLSTNSRIFQSDNRWCIIPNSCYEAAGFTTLIRNYTAFLRYQPPNILALKTGYLTTNNAEVVTFERFNPFGRYIGTESRDAHIGLPADVQNIGNDLVVEYLPPYKEVSIDYNIESFNHRKYQASENQFFNYGNTGYIVNEGFIGQYDYTLGNSLYSHRSLQAASNASFYIPILTSQLPITQENTEVRTYKRAKLNIGYSINENDYFFRYSIKYTQAGASDRWYDPATESWAFSVVYINEEVDRATYDRVWSSISLDFDLIVGDTLEVIIYRPFVIGARSDYALYIGEVSLQVEDVLEQKIHNYKITQGNNTDVYEQERLSVEHITGVQVAPNYEVANGQYAQRPRDNYPTWIRTNRAEVINREIMNDFRKGVHRYEGTLKNNHYKPLSLLNRVWINFGASVMQLPDSCYIDSMQVSLKRNAYKVNMHLPNIDSDVTAVEKNQFKK